MLKVQFGAEEVVAVIYQQYFHGERRQESRDPDFLDKLSGVFICFVATVVLHCFKS